MFWIWVLYIAFLIISIPLSWWTFRWTTRAGLMEKISKISVSIRNILVVIILLIPAFLEQPRGEERIFLGIGLFLVAIGAIIWIIARLEFWKYKIPLWPKGWKTPHLAKTGIYGYIRHPFYLSLCFLYTGYNFAWGALYALYFIVPLAIANIVLTACLEERYILEPTFGEEYREYQRKTGMLLPYIGKRRAL